MCQSLFRCTMEYDINADWRFSDRNQQSNYKLGGANITENIATNFSGVYPERFAQIFIFSTCALEDLKSLRSR